MTEPTPHRPDLHTYFMTIAMAVRTRADCTGNRVGAVLVRDKHILATGYNGTPGGHPNCSEGGCDRCNNPHKYPTGAAYEACICIHAELNAILQSAKFGISTSNSTIYTTMRPCMNCTKELLQAGIIEVHYLHEWTPPDPVFKEQYEKLQTAFPKGLHKLNMPDPDEAWAVRSKRTPHH